MQIKSLYMPTTSIQNDDFPAHILWNKADLVEITFTLSKNLELKDVYNVPEGSIELIEESSFKLSQFEINGYAGFVFSSKLSETPRAIEFVLFEVKDTATGEVERIPKSIDLFRPDIELISAPERIKIRYDSEQGKFHLSEKINVKNCGGGTALIEVKLQPSEDAILSTPDGMGEFKKKVIVDLENEMEEVKKEFVEYNAVVDDVLDLLKNPVSLDEEGRVKMNATFSNLSNKFEENGDFHEKFSLAFTYSYFKNLKLLTKIESFLNYLDSIGKNKIVIHNSIEVLKVQQTPTIIHLSLQRTDLAFNEYPEIEIPPIEVEISECTVPVKIPIHCLFNWG